jgi:hypothetical protein
MKDFAKTRRSCNKLKSALNSLKQSILAFVRTTNKIVRISLRIVLILLCLIGVLFIILPHVISYDTNQNLLFYQYDNNDEINKIFFAFLKSDANQIEVYQLPLTYSSQLLNMQQQRMEETTLKQSLVAENSSLDEQSSTWLSGRVVGQTYVIPTETTIGQAADLRSVVSRQALTTFRERELSDLPALLKLMLFMKRTQWQAIKTLQDDSLPVTAVLPSNCPIAIINTTDISGLAATTSYILEKSGARVIRVDSNGQQLEQTRLVVDNNNLQCQPVVAALTNQVLLGKIDQGTEEDQQLLNRYRADIVLLLGNIVAD